MTDLNAQTIQALLDAATPGEWKVGHLFIGEKDGKYKAFIDMEKEFNAIDVRDRAFDDAALIASATLVAQLYLDQCKVVEKLEEALRFYANEDNYVDTYDLGAYGQALVLQGDHQGNKAREALAAVRKGK